MIEIIQHSIATVSASGVFDESFQTRSDDILTRFKVIEQRVILYEASKRAYRNKIQKPFDMLYHTYCHFRVLQAKVDNIVISGAHMLNKLYKDYIENLRALQT